MAGRVLPKAIRAFGGAGFVAAAVLTQMSPAPAHAANVPDPVNAACAATGACWSTMTTTNPGGPNFSNSLGGVSCPSPTFCVAVGDYSDNGSAYQTLAEQWNGSTWSTMTTTNPGGFSATYGASSNYLNGVSCTSSSFCVAVGNYFNNGYLQTLAEQWNGSSWSTMTTPNTDPANDDYLKGVTCTSPTFCVAVGYTAAPTGGYTNLAELWNGSSWSTMTTQNLGTNANALYNTLIGVSCKPSSFCVAVGSYVGASNGQTLAETYGNSLGLSI